MNDNLLTNGWMQLTMAVGAAFGLVCFFVVLGSGELRFPKPNLG